MAVGLIEDEVREQLRSRAVDPSTEPEKVRSIIAEIVSATELARARAGLPALPSAKDEAKAEGLWALGHPTELGGGGMNLVRVNLCHLSILLSSSGPRGEAQSVRW